MLDSSASPELTPLTCAYKVMKLITTDRIPGVFIYFASKLYKSIQMKCYTIILRTIISSKSAYTEDHTGSNLP